MEIATVFYGHPVWQHGTINQHDIPINTCWHISLDKQRRAFRYGKKWLIEGPDTKRETTFGQAIQYVASGIK